jgi:hypothetical protein
MPDLDNAYDTSIAPTFGINAVFVGGDYDFRHRGYENLSAPVGSSARFAFSSSGFMVPNVDEHVVFKETEVRRPSKLIVFADSQLRAGGPAGASDGYANVNAPISNGVNWTVVRTAGEERFEILNLAKPIGIPKGRFGKGAAVGFFDGHAASKQPGELLDMRLWANDADDEDWDFVDHFTH